MEVSDLTAGVSVFAGHTVGFQSEYSFTQLPTLYPYRQGTSRVSFALCLGSFHTLSQALGHSPTPYLYKLDTVRE
jgi:hypothetical protein